MTKRPAPRANRKTRSRTPPSGWTSAQKRWALGLAALAVALVTLLSLLWPMHGRVTEAWLTFLRRGLGWGVWGVPFALMILSVWIITIETAHPVALPWNRLFGALILYLMGLALTHHFVDQPTQAADAGLGGGHLGLALSALFTWALGRTGAVVIMIVLIGIGLTLAVDVPLGQVVADFAELLRRSTDFIQLWWQMQRERIAERRLERRRALPPAPPIESVPIKLPPARSAPVSAGAPPRAEPSQTPVIAPVIVSTGSASGAVQWSLPRVQETLDERDELQMSLSDIRDKTRIIEDTLRNLGVPVTVVEVNPGPVVTQFGLEPGYVERRDRDGKLKRAKVKVSRITALSNDLALALAASPIRIEAPVPGKGVVGLEVPNGQISTVGLRGVMESDEFRALNTDLALALGRDVSGAALASDLTKLPHLLIAGATGSGKSVCINAFVACLLFKNSPDQLKMLMIDPKRVELSSYNGIPHLLAPVVGEADRVVGVLNWVTHEMDRRYRVFAKMGVRNIQTYNEQATARGEDKMPFIVVFIDELADLMMVAPEEVERLLCRIAQMARATGIHLVVATQRPSVDVVTGLIKANFPARIAFAVSSQIDSRVILDTPGAEKLLGRGDALFMAPDSPKLMRMQGCYVSDAELNRLVTFWQGQAAQAGARVVSLDGAEVAGAPLVQQALWPDMAPKPEEDEDGEDPLLKEAIALVTKERRASVSFLQRHLRIGYTRSARLVDILEAKGIVGPATSASKVRDVLVAPPDAAPAQPEQRS